MICKLFQAFNLEEFEFSQSYLFFWDKIERSNYFLHTIAETALRKEPIDGRLMAHLLSNPTNDGGQWDMVLNLINKYGIMPKKCFAESFSSEASQKLNSILKSTVSLLLLLLIHFCLDRDDTQNKKLSCLSIFSYN